MWLSASDSGTERVAEMPATPPCAPPPLAPCFAAPPSVAVPPSPVPSAPCDPPPGSSPGQTRARSRRPAPRWHPKVWAGPPRPPARSRCGPRAATLGVRAALPAAPRPPGDRAGAPRGCVRQAAHARRPRAAAGRAADGWAARGDIRSSRCTSCRRRRSRTIARRPARRSDEAGAGDHPCARFRPGPARSPFRPTTTSAVAPTRPGSRDTRAAAHRRALLGAGPSADPDAPDDRSRPMPAAAADAPDGADGTGTEGAGSGGAGSDGAGTDGTGTDGTGGTVGTAAARRRHREPAGRQLGACRRRDE